MWDGFNKRKFPRINVRCEIRIQPEVQPPISAETENLGVGGVCVILNVPLERFSRCHIRLELDEKSSPIQCDGKVSWIVPTRSAKDKKKKCFDTGIEFEGLDPDDLEIIKDFLEVHAKKNPLKA